MTSECQKLQSLWPSVAIWRHNFWWTLAQAMCAWWHQAITWTDVHLWSKAFCRIYLRGISQAFMNLIHNMCSEVTPLKLPPYLPGANNLRLVTTRTTRTSAFWDTPCRPMITHTSDSHQKPCQNKTKSKLQILNKANLRDLIAATGLVILLKLDSNRRFFSPCDLEIWRMTLKVEWWIQTGVTVRKRLIWVKIDDFFRPVTLKFDGWPWKTIGHLFYATSSFVQHFVAIGEFKLEWQSGNGQSGSNSTSFLAVWPWNLADHLEKQ